MTAARAPVEVLYGEAADAVRGIEGDFAMLEAGRAGARVWTCSATAAVLGVSRDAEAEVNADECRRRGVALLRRASGGGTVVVGPGTVQYAILLPHLAGDAALSLGAAKSESNDAVRDALARCGVDAKLTSDASGDLRIGDRKVGGLALRRHRDATLVHGTLLMSADLELIGAILRHPAREPEWRRGRPHAEFLASLGRFDVDAFARELKLRAATTATTGR